MVVAHVIDVALTAAKANEFTALRLDGVCRLFVVLFHRDALFLCLLITALKLVLTKLRSSFELLLLFMSI